jgi:hypothetical protein
MMVGLGQETVVRLPDTFADAVPGTWTIATQGPALPPGFVPPPFNCPAGSDFTKSQEVGMCVGPAYDPIYSQAVAGGQRVYYNLDGSVAGMDTGKTGTGSGLGISPAILLAAVGLFLVIRMAR